MPISLTYLFLDLKYKVFFHMLICNMFRPCELLTVPSIVVFIAHILHRLVGSPSHCLLTHSYRRSNFITSMKNNGYSFLVIETAIILIMPIGCSWLKIEMYHGVLWHFFSSTLLMKLFSTRDNLPLPYQGTLGNVWKHF